MKVIAIKGKDIGIAFHDGVKFFLLCDQAIIGDDEMCQSSCKLTLGERPASKPYFNCARVAAHCGPLTLNEVGKLYNITRERVRQLEVVALRKLRLKGDLNEVRKLFTC